MRPKNQPLPHDPSFSSEIRPRLIKLKSFYLLIGLILTLLVCVLVASTYISATHQNISLPALMRDPSIYAGLPPYIGLISNLGVLLWCSTTTLCLFGSLLLKESSQKTKSSFLLYGGLFSMLLTFDDLFLLHENSFWLRGLLSIPEKFIFLAYGMLLILFLIRFWRIIFNTKEWRMLTFSLMLFSASISVDLLNMPIPYSETILVEDGCKLFGIFFWFSYYLSICWEIPYRSSQQPTEH